MNRVLIVDDEYFVRRGLIEMIPWRANQFEVVGEASNGQKALEFLNDHQVDILITDLTMPVMSGIELIKQVRPRYPLIHIVVLTCHQDFNSIQEAMRLGAIDYIVKTEMENDDALFSAISRLSDRIAAEKKKAGANYASGGLIEAEGDGRDMWLAIPLQLDPDRVAAPLPHALEVSGYGWLANQPPSSAGGEWVQVLIRDFDKAPEKLYGRQIAHYLDRVFFYQYKLEQIKYELSWKDIENGAGRSDSTADHFIRHWRSFHWVFDETKYAELLGCVHADHPPAKLLMPIIWETLRAWKSSFINGTLWDTCLSEAESLRFWAQGQELLDRIRAIHGRETITQEAGVSVLQAIDLMSRDLKAENNQIDIAKHVNFNRSYFSYCFKQYTGKAYQDAHLDLRIAHATELLLSKKYPVYAIADMVGFKDEKYFSRVYKQRTGKLPSEVKT